MTHPTLAQVVADYIESRQQKTPDKWPTKADWLEDAAKRAKQISLVSHAPKFTHSDAKGNGALLCSQANSQVGAYLSTSELTEITLDVVGNAAALDVANLLLLQGIDGKFIDQLQSNDTAILAMFSQDSEQITRWQQGLLQALEPSNGLTHTLAKQTYFPIGQGEYHLLSPLFASSLCHALDQRIQTARFSDLAKAAREARRNDQYCDTPIIEFPDLAEQHFGGTKPQNISLLNSLRRGRAFLLSCQPPSWQQQFNVPQDDEQFWRLYSQQTAVKATLRQLMAYLIAVQHQQSSAEHKQRRAELIDDLISELHQYAAQLRTLCEQQKQIMHGLSHGYHHWLQIAKPSSDHPATTSVIEPPTEDWAEQIGQQFARWLNGKLQSKLKHIGDAELTLWRRQVKHELRLLKHDLEGGL